MGVSLFRSLPPSPSPTPPAFRLCQPHLDSWLCETAAAVRGEPAYELAHENTARQYASGYWYQAEPHWAAGAAPLSFTRGETQGARASLLPAFSLHSDASSLPTLPAPPRQLALHARETSAVVGGR